VYAYNNENFGPGSLLGRTSDREMVLRAWTIIKNDEGKLRYFAALNAISTEQDATQITTFIREAMKVDCSAVPKDEASKVWTPSLDDTPM
jgi:hypothetical protein